MSDDDMVTIHSSIVPVRDVLEAFNNPGPLDSFGDPAELLTPETVAARGGAKCAGRVLLKLMAQCVIGAGPS